MALAAAGTAPEQPAESEPCRVSLMVRGVHNVLNSLAAIAVLDLIGTSPREAAAALASFSGAARRFQIKGEAGGVTIVDDYAHHPTEIAATLEAARSGGWTRVIGAFQPHLYSRTRYLHDEFGQALNNCDLAIVTDIYRRPRGAGARHQRQAGRRLGAEVVAIGERGLYSQDRGTSCRCCCANCGRETWC